MTVACLRDEETCRVEMQGLERRLLASRPWSVFTRSVIVPRVLAGVELPGEGELLQLGCGAGGETEALARRLPRWRITATDYDPDMTRRAAERVVYLGERVWVEQADATRLPYTDGHFDLVVAILVWHHVGDWRAATGQAHRVLRPGGALLLADLAVPEPVARRAPGLAARGAYTFADLQSALAAAGFDVAPVKRLPSWYRLLARR